MTADAWLARVTSIYGDDGIRRLVARIPDPEASSGCRIVAEERDDATWAAEQALSLVERAISGSPYRVWPRRAYLDPDDDTVAYVPIEMAPEAR